MSSGLWLWLCLGLLASVPQSLATTCPSVGSAGSAIYRCVDSGNTSTNGTNLRDTITATALGDTIVLPAGVTFSTGTSAESSFIFPAKTGTGWITIQSDKCAELPEGVRVSPSSTTKMATLEVNGSGGNAIRTAVSSHHLRVSCVLLTTGSNISAVNGIVNALVSDAGLASIGTFPHHIWFDRCIFRPYEYAAGASDPFRSVSQGVVVEGEEIWVTDSYFYEFGGARTDLTPRSVSAISEGATPVMTAASMNGHPATDALGMYVYGATGWWVRFNGYNYCYVTASTTCELRKVGIYVVVSGGTAKFQSYLKSPHGFQAGDTVTISGFPGTGTGSDFNGAKTIGTVPADWEFTFSTAEADGIYCLGGNSCQFQLSGSSMFARLDSTGQGTLTGTVTYREVVLHNSYGIAVVAAPGPLRVYNTFLEAQFSSIFLGGGGSATAYSATMSSPAAGGATFSNTIGLRVGEIVALQTDYTSYLSGWRTVKIDTIDQSTGEVTWTPWGITKLQSSDDPLAVGTCSTSGTDVTTSFTLMYQGTFSGVPMVINGVTYTVSYYNGYTALVLTGSAGTQSNVACNIAMLPKSGGSARWRGLPGTTAYVHRSEFTVAPWGPTLGGICKASHETKISVGGVWDGNTYSGVGCAPWGLTQRNQTGGSPWSTLGRTTWSNNLITKSDRIWVMLLDDDLATTVREEQSPGGYGGGNLRFDNNLILGDSTDMYGNASSDYAIAVTGDSSIFSHNSILKPTATITGIVNGPTYNATLVPTYGLQTSVYESNIFNRWGYGWNTGSAFPLKTTNTKRNIIVGDGTSQGTIDADVPGNLYEADTAGIGLVGTCNNTGTNWKNCKLDAAATHKGAGLNGSDPGADPVQIEDRLNGWSVAAGLLDKWTLEPTTAFAIGSTRAAIRFRKIAGTACTLILYTTANRSTEHGDTNTDPEKACTRTGNTVDGDVVNFVLGTNTALTASTTYYYQITTGNAVMVGQFTTRATGSGLTYRWSRAMECGTDGATFGTAVSAWTAYSVPASEVRYCRESSPVGSVQALVAP